MNDYRQGVEIYSSDKDFGAGIKAAVDYRGDITVELKTGNTIEGYLFNVGQNSLDLFPKQSPRKESILILDIKKIHFSGQDTAKGKSWEDWVKKRAFAKRDD